MSNISRFLASSVLFVAFSISCPGAGVCKDYIFSNGLRLFGWNYEVRLDSAAWDMENSPGSMAYYSYANDSMISRSVLGSSDGVDTTIFRKKGSRALSWLAPGAVDSGLVAYSATGFVAHWIDSDLTERNDTLILGNDTTRLLQGSKENGGEQSHYRRMLFPKNSGSVYIFHETISGISDSVVSTCTESLSGCSCDSDDGFSFSISRKISNGVVADTLWFGNNPLQALFYTQNNPTAIMSRKITPHHQPASAMYDLLGRKIYGSFSQ